MELSERKKDVLALVVRNYIHNGEPTGSKSMCDALGGISSATIRNEMNALENLQLLCHPHTSAGRIPTLGGFRFYIDHLMRPSPLTSRQKQILQSLLPDFGHDSRQGLRFAASALSQATKCTAILTDEADRHSTVHKVDLLPISANTALLMLITSSGSVLSRTYHFPVLYEAAVESFLRVVNQFLGGETIENIQPASLQTIAANSGENALDIAPMISALSELIGEAGESRLDLFGEANLLSCADFSVMKAKEIFSLLTRRDEVLTLLELWGRPSGIILGGDTPYRALDHASFVISQYRYAHTGGYIGIIGPTRMDYESILPSIQYFADQLSQRSGQER